MSVNNPNVSELHRLCVNALHGYISETNKTCRLLEQITAFPAPIEQRMAMLDQRRAESDAHERYQAARQNLFDAAKWE